VQTTLSIQELNTIIACPLCKRPMLMTEGLDAACHGCQETYRWLAGTWDVIPSSFRGTSTLWPTWDQLQANGVVGYQQDPEHNLAVGERQDCALFSRFCGFDGLALDVGCGPQPWPAYFRFRSDRTRFVGIDPLIQGPGPEYFQIRALSEFLPFRSQAFDHVIFATSLDHIINPAQALREARRVCRVSGEIDIWNGEKREDAPRATVNHEWYGRLEKPQGAADVFHLRRLRSTEAKSLFAEVDLMLAQEQAYRTDEYRTNFFYRLKVR
jgi:SAM-dependent methyltransferase